MESPLVCPDRDLSPVGGGFHSAWLEVLDTWWLLGGEKRSRRTLSEGRLACLTAGTPPPSLRLSPDLILHVRSYTPSHNALQSVCTVSVVGECIEILPSILHSTNSVRMFAMSALLHSHPNIMYNWLKCPAHVVQWSNHLGAMCSRVWRLQWLRIDSSLGPGASAY